MNVIERKNMISVQFENIISLMNYKPTYNKRKFDNFLNGNNEDYGPTNNNAKDAIKHALLGDKELYDDYLNNMIIELDKDSGYYTTDYKTQIPVIKRKIKYSDFGDEIDIHKIYRGELSTAWRKTERVEVDVTHHLVTLLVDIGGNYSVKVEDSLWRASVVVKLVRDLENAGKSVQVIVGNVTRNVTRSNKTISTSLVVKPYNQSLSLERLTAMCNLGFRRSAGFAMTSCAEESLNPGLGQPTNLSHDLLPWQLKDEEDKGHTKFVIVGRSLSKRDALRSLQDCYAQMKNFSGEEK